MESGEGGGGKVWKKGGKFIYAKSMREREKNRGREGEKEREGTNVMNKNKSNVLFDLLRPLMTFEAMGQKLKIKRLYNVVNHTKF